MTIDNTNPWLTCYSPNPSARLRLFCFAYAGGSGRIFQKWNNALPNFIEVCPIELPGRWSRRSERLLSQVPPMVHEVCMGIRALLDMPFALFGHSFGALLAFEVSRRLRKLGMSNSPTHLFVSGKRSPQLEPVLGEPIHKLPDDMFIDALDRKYGGVPDILRHEPELLELFTPVMKADLKALETYVYVEEPPFAFPITVFGATGDRSTPTEDLRGWTELTTSETNTHITDGDHFFIDSQPNFILEEIVRALKQAQD